MSFAINRNPITIKAYYGELLNPVNRMKSHHKHEVITETKVFNMKGELISSSFKTRLEIEAENLKAAESKIADVDIASQLI